MPPSLPTTTLLSVLLLGAVTTSSPVDGDQDDNDAMHVLAKHRVLLISMDGFRWDYLDKMAPLPNFERMEREGTRAQYINNTFMTSTFPTHYSIATGQSRYTHHSAAN
jgi:predicted AlkP superfamily pyrophosphatase or phosphodiesterase